MTTVRKGWWHSSGLSISGGWHPLAARIRAGRAFVDEEDLYDIEHSEERLMSLKEKGINLIVDQFDRGFSDHDQERELVHCRKTSQLCKKLGLKHGCYMSNTIYFESMLKDHPECEEWAVVTHDGRHVHYGEEQSWRWVACFNSPGWRERMRRQVRIAIEDVGTDFLHFDNLAVWPEPDSCHCVHCQARFKDFLSAKYPDSESQRKRFGFDGFDTFRAPNFYLRFMEPWDLDRIYNPLMQEWILFRCWTVTDYIRELAEYARGLNPQIAIESNGQSVWGLNQALVHGIDSTAQAEHIDIMCEENPDGREDHDIDAAPLSVKRLRGFNLLRRLEKTIWSGYKDAESLTFNLTFSGSPGINSGWGYAEPRAAHRNPAQPGVMSLLEHWARWKNLYVGAVPAARTAVWRNQRSLAWVSAATHLSVCVMEQVLFNRRIPFSIVQDQWIEPERLQSFDLLVVPNMEFVSDREGEVLRQFVQNGGALLVTEQSGAFDDWGRKRHVPLFVEWCKAESLSAAGSQTETAVFDPHRQRNDITVANRSNMIKLGKGRIAYLPEIEYRYAPHAFASHYNVHYDGIDSRYWKDPWNVKTVIDMLEWLSPCLWPLKFYGAPELKMDWLRLSDGRYAAACMRTGEIEGNTNIHFAVRADVEPSEAQLFIPEEKSALDLQWCKTSRGFETELKGIYRHGVVCWR
ncbi:MAG: beta-galactosidase [Lentisphaerae bacterium]|nr:beta-galactosidase [Lentisphaerota bacterium]